jgi:hypothetical protein
MQPGTIESVAGHLESHTQAWLTIAAAMGPLIAVGALVFVIIRFLIPFLREEAKNNREHLIALVAQRGKEAQEDIAANRELSKIQQAAIVERVEVKVEDLHTKVSGVHEAVQRIVIKMGLSAILLLGVYGSGILSGYHFAKQHQPSFAQPTTANECPKGCAAGWYCCGREGQCCEQKKATASKLQPTSANGWPTMLTLADRQCHGAHHICW